MAKNDKSAKRDRPRQRTERRFEPRPIGGPGVVYPIGALGTFALGAGAWELFGGTLFDTGIEPAAYGQPVLVAGALMVALAAWLGTSGEPALRVGAAGLAVEKRGLRRIPWYAITQVTWRQEAVRVSGKDEAGNDVAIVARLSAQPQAAAWIAKEARERIPAIVDIPSDATLPDAAPNAGKRLDLEPPQAVGKHCAASGRVISFEPDARICPRCERVYHKTSVPEECACGAKLAGVAEIVENR
jgi:hypothetical protein